MKPIDPMMDEHRVIERMIGIMRRKSAHVREASLVDATFIDGVVDFFGTYTDRTHHGKEEGIFFRGLAGKPLTPDDRQMMQGLIQGHRYARRTVAELEAAGQAYRKGKYAALEAIVEQLTSLIDFYPGHIRVEDETFFPHSLGYLTPEEQQDMLAEFWEWDRMMIHEKYRSIIEDLERTLEAIPEAPRGTVHR
jgi:hemerythrin-like domain-containing protein